MCFPDSLTYRLQERRQGGTFREVYPNFPLDGIDFCSNDYLGFSRIRTENFSQEGATGSRLVTGTHYEHCQLEEFIAKEMGYEAALLYNSGYDANIGLISCVAQRGDTVLFDEMAHASMRDGMQLSFAKKIKFRHNDLNHLEDKLKRRYERCFILTESIFSMDGDGPDIQSLLYLCEKYKAWLILDEAHSFGLKGKNGKGILAKQENRVLANIITFGKALGSHGACILGSQNLKDYLVNFSRSFIYTTAPSPQHAVTLLERLKMVFNAEKEREKLNNNIEFYLKNLDSLKKWAIPSQSPIQCLSIPGKGKKIEKELQRKEIRVKAILPPTVPKERIRICLHSFNTEKEILFLLNEIKSYL